MPHAIFELDTIDKLPLWAQVLMAARTARRAVLALPKIIDADTRATLLRGCEAIEQCAAAGTWPGSEESVVRKAMDLGKDAEGLIAWTGRAVYLAGDAAHAAHDSLDFSAAESACSASARRSMQAASSAAGMNPLQVMTLMAADLDTIRFACGEARTGRYDGLGKQVMGRMFPVHAPENGEREEPGINQPR